MKHKLKARKRKNGRQPEPPASMSLKDRLQILAWIMSVFAIFVAVFHFLTTRQQTTSLDQLVEQWRHDYHLNDEQARRIRAMEEDFHGSGDPLVRPGHTPTETREHHRAMATLMNPEDGERFFKEQENISLHDHF